MQKVTVNAPCDYANSLLNGTKGLVISENSLLVEVLLTSAEHAGRVWQFNPAHIRIH